MWVQRFVDTARGTFEIFEKGEGEPLAVTHLYSEYDERGNAFANPFTEHYHVYLINLRGAGKSESAQSEEQYSMKESVLDLEAIREALTFTEMGICRTFDRRHVGSCLCCDEGRIFNENHRWRRCGKHRV